MPVAASDEPEILLPRLNILVVDDDGINRLVASELLAQDGHQVSTVDSGFAALERAGQTDLDVVLMDLGMPGMDGLEVTRRLRTAGFTVPVIGLTAHVLPEHRAACLSAGMNAVIHKPFQTSVLRRLADFVAKFRDAGYAYVTNEVELKALPQDTKRLLGLFNLGNMDGALDRKFLKAGSVKRFPNQPDLTDMTAKALDILSQNPNGFFLMVESGMIDKYTHLLDMERAVYDTIMLDNAVKLAKDGAQKRGDDTLILVVADHSHPVSLIGTIDDDMTTIPNVPLRDRVRTYNEARFPRFFVGGF